ncbi:MAG: mechanosensitive ion channel family protein [Spirulinaceae cyanobacterium]
MTLGNLTLPSFLTQPIFNNTPLDYLLAGVILIAGFAATQFFRAVILRSLKRWADRTRTPIDNFLVRALGNALTPLGNLGTVYLALGNLNLHPILQEGIRYGAVLWATVIGIQFLTKILEYGIRTYLSHRSQGELDQSVEALFPIMRILVWAIGLIFLLDNIGFDVSAIIASLGVGGIAIAFAAQGILGDLFSYFSILLDRPFVLGDFIVVGDFVGTVEHIGIKTTRLTSLTGEELVMANTNLTSSRIRNYKHMQERRISFSLGVVYEITAEQLAQIPSIIAEIITGITDVRFDRAHFSAYGDFSLNYEVVYYVLTPDYGRYMDIQQQINLELFERFEAAGIEFAYPTQVQYLQPAPEMRQVLKGHGNGQGDRELATQNS